MVSLIWGTVGLGTIEEFQGDVMLGTIDDVVGNAGAICGNESRAARIRASDPGDGD